MSVEPNDPKTGVERKLKSLLDERLAGLSDRIRQWLEESHARAGSLAEIIEQARSEPLLVEPGLVSPASSGDASRDLAAFAHDVEQATDQVAILGRLVAGAATQSSRVVLFVVRNDTFIGWFARGLATDVNPRKIQVPVGGESVLGRAHAGCKTVVESPNGRGSNQDLARRLGDAPVVSMLASPLWVRDRIVAVLYADTDEPADAWGPDAIRVMVSLTALSLEALPARTRFPRPVAEPMATSEEPELIPVSEPQEDQIESPAAEGAEVSEPEEPAPAADEADPEELRLHEEARRFARLLVSEILLYNEKEIEEGRRNKDLYQRLKEDIDRSRQMYMNRLTHTGGPDYFLQELVRSLAAGDESALNVPWG